MSTTNRWQYATDWHQCRRCGCTYKDYSLKRLEVLDTTLNLKSELYECTDAEQCARYKGYREVELARSRGLSPAVPIRKRGGG